MPSQRGGANTKTLTAANLPKISGLARIRGASPWNSAGTEGTNRVRPFSSASGAFSIKDVTDATWWQNCLNDNIDAPSGQELHLNIGETTPTAVNVQQLYRTAKIYFRTA